MTLHLDFETRSKVDIWKTGAWAYAAHPSTEILCLAYTVDDSPVRIITYEDFQFSRTLPFIFDELYDAVRAGERITAHNAFFEQSVWTNIMMPQYGAPRVPIKQWRCTMAKALARALPRNLADCGRAVGASILKSDEGKRVMLKLCKPKADGSWSEDPEDFQKLYDYCANDVEAERAIDKLLPDLISQEQTVWFLDQLINRRGVYVDRRAIEKALEFVSDHTETLNNIVADVSGGKLDGVSRRLAVLSWCHDQGVAIEGYTKSDVATTLAQENLPDPVKQVLGIKLQLGKTSVKKYEAMAASVGADDRIRDILLYHGASTGRWAGKLIQLQNLPKGINLDTDIACSLLRKCTLDDFQILYPGVMETLSACIRGMIIASPGFDLLVADYAAIEARAVMWLADEQYGLGQFEKGVDLYVEMARAIYLGENISKDQRQLGKAAVLGCGYGMGAVKFLATCLKWGIPVSEGLAQKAVDTYRSTYRRVYDSWFEQERAATQTVATGKSYRCGKITWLMDRTHLLCRLPSGRCLVYNDAQIGVVETSWGEKKDAITFMGLKKVEGQTTTKWERTSTYGGKLVENITQAVARDILANAMVALEVKGYPIIFSVHDEIVAEVPENIGSVEEFVEIMCQLPKWAEGCPITAEGWRGKRYKK